MTENKYLNPHLVGLVKAKLSSEEEKLFAAAHVFAEGKTPEEIENTSLSDLLAFVEQLKEEEEKKKQLLMARRTFEKVVFDDPETAKLAKKQDNAGPNHYEATEDEGVKEIAKAIQAGKTINDMSVAGPQPKPPEITEVKVTGPMDEAFEKFAKELKGSLEELIDKKFEEERRMEESYPRQSVKYTPSDRSKREHDTIKKWREGFDNSEVGKTLKSAMRKNMKIKPQTILGQKLADKMDDFVYKTVKIEKLVEARNKVMELDNRLAAQLRKVSEAEWIITRNNIVSKTARKILGVRFPDEPEYIERNGKKVTRWAEIARKAAEISHIKDTDPNRVTRQTPGEKVWSEYIRKEINTSPWVNGNK